MTKSLDRRQRAVLLGLLLGMVAVIVALLILERQRDPGWRTEVALLARQTGQEIQILHAERSANPQAFEGSSPFVPISSSDHYRPVTEVGSVGSDSRPPAPFPAAEVWCFQLLRDGHESWLLAARHVDLHRGDWLVYEAISQSVEEADSTFQALACRPDPTPTPAPDSVVSA